jgi:hypothetical protein
MKMSDVSVGYEQTIGCKEAGRWTASSTVIRLLTAD